MEFVNTVILAFTLIATILGLMYQSKQNIKERKNETRPIIFASMFGCSNILCNNRTRNGYSRFILCTPEYQNERQNTDIKPVNKEYVFLRLRNTTKNAAYNVKIKISIIVASTGANYLQTYTLDTIKGETEDFIFIPKDYYNSSVHPFVDKAEIEMIYSSLSGEVIKYNYSNDNNTCRTAYKKINHRFASSKNCFFKTVLNFKKNCGFFMEIEADGIKSYSVEELTQIYSEDNN